MDHNTTDTGSFTLTSAATPEGSVVAAQQLVDDLGGENLSPEDRKSTRLNSSHVAISYAVFCLKKKNALEQLQLLVVGDGELRDDIGRDSEALGSGHEVQFAGAGGNVAQNVGRIDIYVIQRIGY